MLHVIRGNYIDGDWAATGATFDVINPSEADIMAKIAPTCLSGINLRGVLRFPVERYAADLMPSPAAPTSAAVG